MFRRNRPNIIIDEYYEAALKFCNDHGFKGKELPPYTKVGHTSHCPLENALNTRVGQVTYGGGKILPEQVQTFIQLADKGHYPQLGKPQ